MAMDRQKAAKAISAGSSLRFNQSHPAVVEAESMVIHRLAEKNEISMAVKTLYGFRVCCLCSLHPSGLFLLFFTIYRFHASSKPCDAGI